MPTRAADAEESAARLPTDTPSRKRLRMVWNEDSETRRSAGAVITKARQIF